MKDQLLAWLRSYHIPTICATVLILAFIAASWHRLGTPESTEVYNTSYANHSQWQATVVFPGAVLPFDVEHFVWEREPMPPAESAAKFLEVVKSRCIFWSAAPMAYSNAIAVSCYKEKKPKYEKVKP